MGRQGNRLAWVLADSDGAKTLVQEGRYDPENEDSHECDGVTHIPGDGNVLP